MRREREDRKCELGNLEERVKTVRQALDDKRREARYEKGRLMTAARIPLATDSPHLSREESNQLKKLIDSFVENDIPNDINGVAEQIEAETQRVQVEGAEGSKKDAEEYDDLEKEEATLEQKIQELRDRRENWQGSMDDKLRQWLTPLKDLVVKINEEYTRLFQKLGYDGRIELSVPQDKYKANEYGIDILVKFRDSSQLTKLNSRTQSGGERSVSTMLYLMALQNICHVPFRCVDEINQGMDETNERKVFNMMTQLLAEKSTNLAKTQYFLLTPKLLRGLEYTDQVTVHVVHNGPTLENAASWDPLKFLRQAGGA